MPDKISSTAVGSIAGVFGALAISFEKMEVTFLKCSTTQRQLTMLRVIGSGACGGDAPRRGR
eukprot:2342617-Prymnesium_polylepis.1